MNLLPIHITLSAVRIKKIIIILIQILMLIIKANEVVDISEVKDNDNCPICNSKLKFTRGIEIGNIFKLGTKYSKAMSAKFLDENGKTRI